MKTELRNSINSRFVIKCEIFKKNFFKIATVLDPRFKTSFFSPEQTEFSNSIVVKDTALEKS